MRKSTIENNESCILVGMAPGQSKSFANIERRNDNDDGNASDMMIIVKDATLCAKAVPP